MGLYSQLIVIFVLHFRIRLRMYVRLAQPTELHTTAHAACIGRPQLPSSLIPHTSTNRTKVLEFDSLRHPSLAVPDCKASKITHRNVSVVLRCRLHHVLESTSSILSKAAPGSRHRWPIHVIDSKHVPVPIQRSTGNTGWISYRLRYNRRLDCI